MVRVNRSTEKLSDFMVLSFRGSVAGGWGVAKLPLCGGWVYFRGLFHFYILLPGFGSCAARRKACLDTRPRACFPDAVREVIAGHHSTVRKDSTAWLGGGCRSPATPPCLHFVKARLRSG